MADTESPYLNLGGEEGLPKDVRNGFIRKVYGLLSIQLCSTCVIAYPIMTMDPRWLAENFQLCQGCALLSLIMVMSVTCCFPNAARTVPYNYVFLAIVTFCESVLVGFICAVYTGESVLMAAMMTAIIFMGLTMYACTTETDFTGFGGYLFAVLLGLIAVSVVFMFIPQTPLTIMIRSGIGAVLFSFYLIYDTQLIMGGKHKQKFGVDDYVFAALNLYLDIINLFIELLRLFGSRK